MSCEDVCLGGFDFDDPEFRHTKLFKARKPTVCFECRKPIQKGDTYEKEVMCYEGDWLTYRTCDICVEIRTAFFCKGWMFESVWETIQDELFPELTVHCLERLTTARAKEFLRGRWSVWKGLQEKA